LSDRIEILRITDLEPFPDHPFQVREDDAMRETAESVKEYGILTPILVRPLENGHFQIVSGHRRTKACELAGVDEIPAIIRDMDYDSAVIAMVDSNLQREEILPSERAAAYKMKVEAIRRQCGRRAQSNEINGDQLGHHLDDKLYDSRKSVEVVADEAGESKTQVQRYIRLTALKPELQQMVDDKKIGMTPAVELSFLKPEEQQMLVDTIASEQATPSLSQAKRMKEMSRKGELNDDSMLAVMSEQKKPEENKIVIPCDAIAKYFPKSTTPHQMERMIYKLLESWQKKKQRQHGAR
jgi:ParB family chromosome partitioning protein